MKNIIIISLLATAAIYAVFASIFGLSPVEWSGEQKILFVVSTIIVDAFISKKHKKNE
jgi:hypothetical protein